MQADLSISREDSLGTNTSYRDQRYVDVIFANVFNSSQDNAPDTKRWDLGNDFRRLLGNRWYANTTQDFLNSEEQGLDLRTTISGGGGRCVLRSPSQYLALGAGVAWTNENYTDPTLSNITTPASRSLLGFAHAGMNIARHPDRTGRDRCAPVRFSVLNPS